MLTREQIEQLAWHKMRGLLPAIIQHVANNQVLMLGYMNKEALQQTMACGKVTFFSRRKHRLWLKGEVSGHYLLFHDVSTDCDRDCLLISVTPIGATCHTGQTSCFSPPETLANFFYQLEQVIADRKQTKAISSYTARLFQQGTHRIAQKVGEEGVETALAAVIGDRDALINESADLIYHLLVLLHDQHCCFSEIIAQLQLRHHPHVKKENKD